VLVQTWRWVPFRNPSAEERGHMGSPHCLRSPHPLYCAHILLKTGGTWWVGQVVLVFLRRCSAGRPASSVDEVARGYERLVRSGQTIKCRLGTGRQQERALSSLAPPLAARLPSLTGGTMAHHNGAPRGAPLSHLSKHCVALCGQGQHASRGSRAESESDLFTGTIHSNTDRYLQFCAPRLPQGVVSGRPRLAPGHSHLSARCHRAARCGDCDESP
jgi:hypothetical protein